MQIIELMRMASGCVGEMIVRMNSGIFVIHHEEREEIVAAAQHMIHRLEYVISHLENGGTPN